MAAPFAPLGRRRTISREEAPMSVPPASPPINHAERRRSSARAPLLLYDDHCSVCKRFVSMIIGADRRGTLRIAPLNSPIGDALRRERPELAPRDSAIWVRTDGSITTHSDAILDAIEYLGGSLTPLGKLLRRLVPRALRDRAYVAFANNRNLFGQFGVRELDARAQSRTLTTMETEPVHATTG
jgi:predicted DCC family thiol-disulfide oxidoreductase YuxK